MERIPMPICYDTSEVESFGEYRSKLSTEFNHVPDIVIETWFYRHWIDVCDWMNLNPLAWRYSLTSMPSKEVLKISHVKDWTDTLKCWGDDLIDGKVRKSTWLGCYMLEHGTTPSPMIVAVGAGKIEHPKHPGYVMKEPYQIIEGHLRLSYLQALIRRMHPTVEKEHLLCIVDIV